ncbi:RNA-directed DNA polymerase [Alishewanella agri BL06]|uniref:RNA-directed DNA polymerase n=1 Tax=Alishewanella agri BL06 TaxID=1195246 RepID=I8UDV6_9ALTE|nr:reverse transcriptase family protein [Alishewanella agri]EIW90163.1 RNA-directed DNA polymerase [Alishewanella agri BL06]
MNRWSSQLFQKEARRLGRSEDVIDNCLNAAALIQLKNSQITPIFSLRHLSYMAKADYGFLRAIVSRDDRIDSYRTFQIRKRKRRKNDKERYRNINVPSHDLKKTQQWINKHILSHVSPHQCSMAFYKDSSIIEAVNAHVGAKWVIKVDVKNFFESINEISVYRVFRELGFNALLSFELARICTKKRTMLPSRSRKWISTGRRETISTYAQPIQGFLPQGAPTSPMLSNLASLRLDQEIFKFCAHEGFIYTRYADDIVISVHRDVKKSECSNIINKLYRVMASNGLSPNKTKTIVLHPGARKVILGLMLTDKGVMLTKEFKSRLRQHLFFLNSENVGPVEHAQHKGFVSIIGLRNHIIGLLSFAKAVDKNFASKCQADFDRIVWPI